MGQREYHRERLYPSKSKRETLVWPNHIVNDGLVRCFSE